jgi:hypothetical protein
VTAHEPALAEYVYEQALVEDHNGHLGYEVRQHPVVKRTSKRIFFTQSGRMRVIDRACFEAKGEAWIRAAGGFLVYANRADAEPARRETSKAKSETPKEEISRLRAAMAAAHPDRGGDPAEFRAAYARYRAAVTGSARTSEAAR